MILNAKKPVSPYFARPVLVPLLIFISFCQVEAKRGAEEAGQDEEILNIQLRVREICRVLNYLQKKNTE